MIAESFKKIYDFCKEKDYPNKKDLDNLLLISNSAKKTNIINVKAKLLKISILDFYNVTEAQIVSETRMPDVVRARQLLRFWLRHKVGMSLLEIPRFIKKGNHSSYYSARNYIKEGLDEVFGNKDFQNEYAKLELMLDDLLKVYE